jgi:hypothetical protein
MHRDIPPFNKVGNDLILGRGTRHEVSNMSKVLTTTLGKAVVRSLGGGFTIRTVILQNDEHIYPDGNGVSDGI